MLPGTWAYKVKRYPDGWIKKCKARLCVRGDKQVDGVDVLDTYAPVLQWSAVGLMMTMTNMMDLKSIQVDCNNAFAQARLKELAYVKIPKAFSAHSD